MSSIGFRVVYVLIILILPACNSSQLSPELQLREDLKKVLSAVSQKKDLSKKLTKDPPSSGMLSEDHIAMFVWVRARAAQMQLATSEDTTKQDLISEQSKSPENKSQQQNPVLPNLDEKGIQADAHLSSYEISALKELEFSLNLYVWVKQTIDYTVAFVNSAGESGIVEYVAFYDPVIKQNISLVQSFAENLQFANNVQLEHDVARQNLNVTQISAYAVNANLIV